jgi:gamma-D-glutamyl-L-lysine dipeptidyl-peptidase
MCVSNRDSAFRPRHSVIRRARCKTTPIALLDYNVAQIRITFVGQKGMIPRWHILAMVLAMTLMAQGDELNLPTLEEFQTPKVVERLARRIEPDLKGRPDRLPQYVDFFRNELGNDSRLCAFNVVAKPGDDGRVVLTGYTEFPETRAALGKYLSVLGFNIDDRLESLPSSDLGKQIFGIVTATHSMCFDRPSGRQRPENDCLLGEPLYLLREEQGHLLAHSGEGYLGFIRSSDVRKVNGDEFSKYFAGKRVRIKSDQKLDGLMIPTNASLKWVANDAESMTLELPTGKQVSLPLSACEFHRDREADVEKLIAAGRQFLGTHYLWGGKTTSGIDCSGLAQSSYAAIGIRLPRDANQQFYVGHLSATRWHMSGLQPGDTLYFLGDDGKIRHTGIYLGNNHFMHAVIPVARINSFNPADPDYDAKRHASFAFAKRPID